MRVLQVHALSVFGAFLVFPTGSCPLRLSPSGELDDPEVFLPYLSPLRGGSDS